MRRLLLILAFATPAFARTLYWDSLKVTAHLDAEGVMHVIERQGMVFDGDWNGGERTFRIRLTQRLNFENLARIDDSGKEIPLVRGDLSQVDHYDFTNANVLRWRSRLPSDPPFSNRHITYVLMYSIASVLQKSGNQYKLDHDFAFPNRDGVIERFTLDLTFDPAWNAEPVHIDRQNLQPGQSVLVTRELTFTGANAPAAAEAPPAWLVPAIAALLIGGMALMTFLFYRAEQAAGRFAPAPSPSEINEQWLRTHLFSMKPEVAGAAWDDRVGAPEVAAVLARLAAEKKITSKVEYKTLSMHLNQPLEAFAGYEHALLSQLFFDGADTDTTRIRNHYQSSGFDPSSAIRVDIESELEKLPQRREKVKRFNWQIALIILVVAAATAIVALIHGRTDLIATAILGFVTVFFWGMASAAARYHRSAISGIGWRLTVVAVVFAPVAIGVIVCALVAPITGVGIPTVIGLATLAIVCWKAVLDTMKITDSPSYIAFRRQLLGARDYFLAQLASQQPQLRDEWLPYLLAFGLGSNVDHWFRSFGAPDSGTHTSTFGSTSTSSSSTSSASSGWTGGGGAFGGAGATGAWAAAAGTLAAGVAAPSSSSSDSGGGGW